MEENIIEINGEKIDLKKLSDEELVKLYQENRKEEKKIKKMIKEYTEKYPFLKNIK